MIYYISVSGSTSNSGTSAASPWPLSKVTSFAFSPGDQILFKKADVFTNVALTFAHSGGSGNRIFFDAYGSGNNPVFDGAQSSSRIFMLNGISNITLNNLVFQNANNDAVYELGCSNIAINNCYWTNVKTGINAVNCNSGVGGIVVNASFGRNMLGPKPKGQFVQFNNVTGPNNAITNNKFWNESGLSNPEDAISIYQCAGISGNPILVDNNWILGGGPSNTGGGIMTGDSTGSYITASNNILVNPGQYGMAIASGDHISLINNKIFGAKSAISNVGMYQWDNGLGVPITNSTISGNQVTWTDKSGNNNPWWLGSGPTPAGFATNNFNAGLTAAILPNPLWTGTPWNSTSPVLNFPGIPAKTYGTADFDPGATSINPITYTSGNTGVATIVSNKIHIIAAGIAVITASDGTSTANQTLTVNKAPLQITANGLTKVYGAANPTLTYAITGFVLGQGTGNLTSQPAIATTALVGSSVGNYPITVSGGVATNYTFNYTGAILAVTKASLTITADSKAKATGTANPGLTASYTGFVNGDDNTNLQTQPTLSTTANTGSVAGQYPITAAGAAAQNYVISYVAGVMTITSSTMIFPPIPGKTYGAADFSANAVSSLPVTLTSDNHAVATIVNGMIHIVSAGTANITADNGSTQLINQLTVLKANLQVIADNHIIFQGDDLPDLTDTYLGFVNGETQSNLNTPAVLATAATSGSPAGAYDITVSGATSPNYNITFTKGTLSIVAEGFIHFKRKIRFVPPLS